MIGIVRRAQTVVRGILRHPVGARRPVATLARIARWQIESRMRPGIHDKAWIEDARLLVERGMTGATGNIYFGLHEFADMGFLLHMLRANDLFLDIGANIGSYSILAGKLAGAKAIAFEPHPDTAEKLTNNINHNGLSDRIVVHRIALSDHDGVGALTESLDTMNRIVEPGDAATREVALRTLDTVLGDAAPTMIKIDVEGHEPQVLAGASATLAKPSLCAIEIETVSTETEALLLAAGFVERHYDPLTRVLSTAPGAIRASNRLFLRNLPEVEDRVANARRFTAAGITI